MCCCLRRSPNPPATSCLLLPVQVRLCPEHAQQLTYQKHQQLLRAHEAETRSRSPGSGTRKRRRIESEPAEGQQSELEAREGRSAEAPPSAPAAVKSSKPDRLDAALDGLFP